MESHKNNKNLKALAASIAHEVKNPLCAIQNCSQIIKDNLKEACEYLELISISSNRGLQIIDMILANIKEENFDKSSFVNLSMADIVQKAIKEFAFESPKEKLLVNVNLENDFTFKGDETLMIFVIFNLLKNSLYYKAKIDIWLNRMLNCNYLNFQDYGVGIKAEKLDNIFDDFFTSEKKGGTGIGLAFCKRVMQAFDGDISCKSVEGKGVHFSLKFPK